MKTLLTRSDEQDLEDIGDPIAQDAPSRALTFVRQLRDRCLTLADFPQAARSSHAKRHWVSGDASTKTV
ncbi:MAG TPA: type II toxin-antitoxin system RelE/ParE family toxin [Sphingomonas sp.]|jgi:plasmid stabilization system protein ParE|uniref:type II toxin-antitoxin system RelE/ParE family toxin n=1 Tax=Sphingomonas sp. TaxID=28214 RepID=UPI002EDAA23B